MNPDETGKIVISIDFIVVYIKFRIERPQKV